MIKQIGLVLLLLIFFAVPSFATTLPLLTKKYERIPGKPDVFTESVSVCNIGASYSIVVQNGENGKNRVSSASIIINGAEAVKESEFNQKVDRIEKKITLLPENTIEIKLKSIPGSFITVNLVCIANCLDAAIATPVDGSAINKSKIIVKGSLYNAYGETGVMVGNALATPSPLVGEGWGEEALTGVRVLAQTQGNNFAGIIPLQTGSNTLTVTATDACGQKAVDSVTVNAVPTVEPIRLSVNPASGVISQETGTFDVTFEADVYGEALNYAWDFDGDGIIDKSGTDMSSVTFGYSQSGLYFPAVTVTDSKGNAYTDTTMIDVLSLEEMNSLLGEKWDGAKDSLSGGNIEKALGYFAPESKEKYKRGFSVLKDKMTEIFGKTEEFVPVSIRDGIANYDNLVVEDDGAVYSYPVIFMLDSDGIWRIKSF